MASTNWKENTPPFKFTHNPSLEPFNVDSSTFCHNAEEDLIGIVVGALVFHRKKLVNSPSPSTSDTSSTSNSEHQEPQDEEEKDHILIIQRARTDSHPLLWEIPGGAVDYDDPSPLYAVARELWEESGLILSHVRREVSIGGKGFPTTRDEKGYVLFTSRGCRVAKYSFEADVPPVEAVGNGGDGKEGHMVTLDHEEHEQYLWVTKEEVEASQCVRNGNPIKFRMTSKEQRKTILQGFKLREEDRRKEE
ncbi:putative nudix domain protein [Zalerion maritima]|uniref:Nudix domain protein n=1 Tax=Zalerion maritima TaxID=339359 RepID=A0AAD5WPN4_9PEZI|nr:putative nudix domain protein [Zalerion maritima]